MEIDKYYVGRLARQSRMQLVPIPDDLQIPQRHMQGISNDEFVTAFQTYQDMLCQIYGEVEVNAESFGMVCLEIEQNPSEHPYSLLDR